MNQLHRITLINSASIDYREVLLDGNIHFIGTQGTGKSTLLRAILFFYNAASRKLGISKEKRAFADYYFPFADSYIFYEVQLGTRHYCVWLYKRQNRLCFRLIDGPWSKELALAEKEVRTEAEIIAEANRLGYRVEKPIYKFTDYRDILYGANRSMRRYALMQNPAYSNIPRTITKVFLNSSLKGDTIKSTIISSLSDELMEINLDTNRHHLHTARSNYEDVQCFQQQERKAQRIVENYRALLETERRQKEVAWQIGATHNRVREQARKLEDQTAEQAQCVTMQEALLERIGKQVADEVRRLHDKLSVEKDNIRKANQLEKKYTELKLPELIEEAARAPGYRQQYAHLDAEKRMLTTAIEKQEQQFEAERNRLEHLCNQQIQKITGELMELKERLFSEKEQSLKERDAERDERTRIHTANRAEQQAALDQARSDNSDLEAEIRMVELRPLFEEEAEALENQRGSLEKELVENDGMLELARSRSKSLEREAESELKRLELEAEAQLNPLLNEKARLEEELTARKSELEALGGSLLEFLEQHKDGWTHGIGQVARKEILLRDDLSPTIEAGETFYGVTLDLSHVEPISLSKRELEAGIKALENTLEQQNQTIEQQRMAQENGRDKAQQRFNKKVREQSEQIKQAEQNRFSLQAALEKNAMAKSRLDERIAEERQRIQDELAEKKHQVQLRIAESEQCIAELDERHNQGLARLEKDLQRRITALDKQAHSGETTLQAAIEKHREKLAEQLKSLQEQREKLLKKQGIDPSRIETMEQEMQRLQERLDQIEENRDLIAVYRNDCENWIDRRDEFKRKRKQLEEEIEHRESLYAQRREREQATLSELRQKMAELKSQQQSMQAEMDSYERFSKEELFESFRTFIVHHDRSDKADCTAHIGEFKNLTIEWEKLGRTLRENSTVFAGHFNEGNCLGLPVHLNNEASYRAFAEELREFVQEQKIVALKTEVTRKYSMVLNTVVKDTNHLLQRESDVQRVIQKINADFKKSNFVTAVRSIEMRLQESSNRVIQVLREICRFQEESHFSFGELDLFNQSGDRSNDKKAVELLERLLVQMDQADHKVLKLEDAFDLEFRICENENDTNWVGSLANVGSNGTDVLVKSMIYINLLHIFKSGGKKSADQTVLHCLVDEVGILHDSNVTGLIDFAGKRNICLINGSPNSHNEQDYKHIYIFQKQQNRTRITKLMSNVV